MGSGSPRELNDIESPEWNELPVGRASSARAGFPSFTGAAARFFGRTARRDGGREMIDLRTGEKGGRNRRRPATMAGPSGGGVSGTTKSRQLSLAASNASNTSTDNRRQKDYR